MTQSDLIRDLIQKTEQKADALAHATLAKAVGYEQYLINVGKYREAKSLAQSLRDRYQREDRGMAEQDDGLQDQPDFDDDDAEASRPRPPRARKPRAWG